MMFAIGFLTMMLSFVFFGAMCSNMFDWKSNPAWGVLWMLLWLGTGVGGVAIMLHAKQADFEEQCKAWGDNAYLYSRNCLASQGDGNGGRG